MMMVSICILRHTPEGKHLEDPSLLYNVRNDEESHPSTCLEYLNSMHRRKKRVHGILLNSLAAAWRVPSYIFSFFILFRHTTLWSTQVNIEPEQYKVFSMMFDLVSVHIRRTQHRGLLENYQRVCKEFSRAEVDKTFSPEPTFPSGAVVASQQPQLMLFIIGFFHILFVPSFLFQ